MITLLSDSIKIRSVSGNEGEFVRFLGDWASRQGFSVDFFDLVPKETERYFITPPRHLPLEGRPALVIGFKGAEKGRTLVFNAHSDTVSAGEEHDWTMDPFSGKIKGDRIYGRGACDDKGPLISALWAMVALRDCPDIALRGDLLIEIVPGEEDCVGVGTLGCIDHGYTADASIILEPTGGIPRNASRGGLRFKVSCRGKSIHGTVKWLEKDAIRLVRRVLDALDEMEKKWSAFEADPLFSGYPIGRPITVDKVQGGKWQGMVCDFCSCEGYFELLPGDDLREWQKRFVAELRTLVDDDGIEVEFSENYRGHSTDSSCGLCSTIEQVMRERTTGWSGWSAFNSGCESGVRPLLNGTPTVVWGPGSVEHAHAPDEYIDSKEMELCAELFAMSAKSWINENN